jgi:hypothetical protein
MIIGIAFTLPQSKLPALLLPGDSIELEVCYFPTELNQLRDTVVIRDSCGPHYIPVRGVGIGNNYLGQGKCNLDLNSKTKKLPIKPFYAVAPPFPNPASSFIIVPVTYINSGETLPLKWKIFNNFGVYISEGKAELVVSDLFAKDVSLYKEIEIQITDIQTGIYLLVVNDGMQAKTFVIAIKK